MLRFSGPRHFHRLNQKFEPSVIQDPSLHRSAISADPLYFQ